VERTVALARQLERAGCSVLTVHGRTRNQVGKTGRQCTQLADWAQLAAVKRALSIPVVANGNVRHRQDAEACLAATSCDGVMSGCGLLTNPGLFSEPGDGPPPAAPATPAAVGARPSSSAEVELLGELRHPMAVSAR
jgi:tRNA-dihydrouridine synthase 1